MFERMKSLTNNKILFSNGSAKRTYIIYILNT